MFTTTHLGLTRLLDKISEGAFHDAAERGDPPRCHPHTRVAIRAEIMDWVNASDARRKSIMWMYGPAGSGKTAIAQSIAEACERAASFFFSRTAAERNDTKRVIATIAYQISRFLPQFEDALLTAIEWDPTIFSRALVTQMRVLVVEPLKALSPSPQPIFVILDGLDEAGPTPEAQANLLNVIGKATEELRHIPLIFLIASRPEYEIREAFNGHLSPLMKSLVLDYNYKPDDDIRLYFSSTFAEIRDKHIRSGTRPRLPSPWPSEREVDRLVSKASGQFIFAATVLKFVDSIRHHPAEQLDVIFSLLAGGHASETPFALLDVLYHYILSSVAEPAKVQQILTMLVLSLNPDIPSNVDQIEEFLDFDIRRVLVDIQMNAVPENTMYAIEAIWPWRIGSSELFSPSKFIQYITLQSLIPLNRPGEEKWQIKFEEASFEPDEQVLYLEDGSLCLRLYGLYGLDFNWFLDMLCKTPQNLDLATVLRECTLQYDGRDKKLKKGWENIAYSSLEYIKVSKIKMYIFHCSLIRFEPCSLPEVWHTISKARPPPRHRRVHDLRRMRRRFCRR
jgi:hypothetical protein